MNRRLARVALHVWLMITLIMATVGVPVQAATGALQVIAAAEMAAAMKDMPCGEEAPAKAHDMPCNCCDPVSCDLSACIGAACLPELTRRVAAIPAMCLSVPWEMPSRPSRVMETPLRPPIA